MRRVGFLVAVLITLPSAGQSVSEAVTVQVVEIDAVVIDRTGAPVDGLTRDDFEVRIGGKAADVTNFYRVQPGVRADARRSAAANEETAVGPELPTRLIVFIDDVHLRPASKRRALDALHAYVRTSMPSTMKAIVVRWNGSRSSMREPKNREALLAQIDDVRREPVRSVRALGERLRVMRELDDVVDLSGPYAEVRAREAMRTTVQYAQERHREAEVTLAALQELVALAAGFPERKIVLYVSDGVPLRAGTETLQYARDALKRFDLVGGNMQGAQQLDDLQYDLTAAFREVIRRAQAANVVLSVLDPGGLRGFEHASVETRAGNARLDSTVVRENESAGMRMVAFQTGGRYVGNENDLDRAISLLTGDVATYYSLGVRAPDASHFDVSVRVRGRDDVRVLTARRRELSSPEEILAAALRTRLHSRAEENPLGATIHLLPAMRENGRCVVPAQIVVPADRLARMADSSAPRVDLAVHAMAMDRREHESPVRSSHKQFTPRAGEPIVETLVFAFQARRYVVSVAIVDGVTGTTSYLQADVDAACAP